MNYMSNVANMLGVRLEEEFQIVDGMNKMYYKFTPQGLFSYMKVPNTWYDRPVLASIVLNGLLIGELQIQKIKPQADS